MKSLVRLVSSTFLLACLLPAEQVRVTHENGVLTVENAVIRRRFDTGAVFTPASFFSKAAQVEALRPGAHPWFEIGVDGEVVSAARYRSHEVRRLAHGGAEVRVRLEAGPLEVLYLLQSYPGSTVTRERFLLTSGAGARLTKAGGRLRLVFPRYSFGATTDVREVRLATWNREQLPDAPTGAFPLDRAWGAANQAGTNLSQCHMFHPALENVPPRESTSRKGPILLGRLRGNAGWLLAYEHGAPDEDPQRDFLRLTYAPATGGPSVAVSGRSGVYLDGEPLSASRPYTTPWVVTAVFAGPDFDAGHAALWDYLLHWQNPQPASRRPVFYYNTWGWQRSDQNDYVNTAAIKDTLVGTDIYNDPTVYAPITYFNVTAPGGRRKHLSPRDVLWNNQERLLREVDYAHELGVDVFVLDDGWFDFMGDWNLAPQAFPNGLAPLKERLDKYGMRLGLWLAPTTLDRNGKMHAEYRDTLARGKNGEVLIGGWKRDMPCLASRWRDYFVAKSKQLIDLGCTYFKWDGLEEQFCYSSEHGHGGASDSPEERAQRYGYEFIRIVTGMARELTEYNPDLVIVYDVTERKKSGVGLEFLSEGRYFWMNNGASSYGDFSTYRAKSMRTIPNLYGRLIPPVLLPHANYPHNKAPYRAQAHNVSSSLLGGNGFWGDLSEMQPAERRRVAALLARYRRSGDAAVSVRPRISGAVGSSPEIYEYLDPQQSAGQVIAFSGSKGRHRYQTAPCTPERFLGVLRHAYWFESGRLNFEFTFTEPDAARQAFILGGNDFGARVEASTTWLRDIRIERGGTLVIDPGDRGTVTVFWPSSLGEPVTAAPVESAPTGGGTRLLIQARAAGAEIRIRRQ